MTASGLPVEREDAIVSGISMQLSVLDDLIKSGKAGDVHALRLLYDAVINSMNVDHRLVIPLAETFVKFLADLKNEAVKQLASERIQLN